jgi:hypothetical protein
MKRIRAKTKNKSKPKKAKAKKTFIAKRKRKKRQGVRSLRGKYKHLDLMKGLVDARKEERKSERHLGALWGADDHQGRHHQE